MAGVQQAPHAERYPRVVALHVHLCVPDGADALGLREAVKRQCLQLAWLGLGLSLGSGLGLGLGLA